MFSHRQQCTLYTGSLATCLVVIVIVVVVVVVVLYVATAYYRRGDLSGSLVPAAATYFVHGLAGYTPTAVMSAHTLQTAAFLSAGGALDPLAYATIPYAGGGTHPVYDTLNVSDAATTSELSPGSTQNGIVDSSGAGSFTPPGYGLLSSIDVWLLSILRILCIVHVITSFCL